MTRRLTEPSAVVADRFVKRRERRANRVYVPPPPRPRLGPEPR